MRKLCWKMTQRDQHPIWSLWSSFWETIGKIWGQKSLSAQSLQLCPTLCNPMDSILLGYSVHGIYLPRILEWVATFSSRGSSPSRDWTHISCVSCIAGDSLLLSHQGSPRKTYRILKNKKTERGDKKMSKYVWCSRQGKRRIKPLDRKLKWAQYTTGGKIIKFWVLNVWKKLICVSVVTVESICLGGGNVI